MLSGRDNTAALLAVQQALAAQTNVPGGVSSLATTNPSALWVHLLQQQQQQHDHQAAAAAQAAAHIATTAGFPASFLSMANDFSSAAGVQDTTSQAIIAAAQAAATAAARSSPSSLFA